MENYHLGLHFDYPKHPRDIKVKNCYLFPVNNAGLYAIEAEIRTSRRFTHNYSQEKDHFLLFSTQRAEKSYNQSFSLQTNKKYLVWFSCLQVSKTNGRISKKFTMLSFDRLDEDAKSFIRLRLDLPLFSWYKIPREREDSKWKLEQVFIHPMYPSEHNFPSAYFWVVQQRAKLEYYINQVSIEKKKELANMKEEIPDAKEELVEFKEEEKSVIQLSLVSEELSNNTEHLEQTTINFEEQIKNQVQIFQTKQLENEVCSLFRETFLSAEGSLREKLSTAYFAAETFLINHEM